MSQVDEVFGEVVSCYTREQAIKDGVLVDVSETAREAGFKFPVAMTAAAYGDCVAWTDKDSARQTYQDLSGRLWDVLWMAQLAAKAVGGREILFQLYRVPRGGCGRTARRMVLKAVCGPGDAAEPVVTIMLPKED